jgi:hypothetical protein
MNILTQDFDPQTLPVAMIQPIKGLTSALAKILVGLQNSIDKRNFLNSLEKYKI